MIDALKLDKPILGGFDWGGNASCIAAILAADKVGGLVSYTGYDVIDIDSIATVLCMAWKLSCLHGLAIEQYKRKNIIHHLF